LKRYTFHINLYDAALFGALFICITFVLLLWFAKRANYTANRLLAGVLMIGTLWLGGVLAIDTGLSTHIPFLARLCMYFPLALGPLIYLFVLKTTRPEQKLKYRDLLHFSPLLLALIAYAWNSVTKRPGADHIHPFWQLAIVLPSLTFVSVIVYLYRCRELIEHSYKQQKFNGGDRYRHEWQWLNRILTAIGLIWLVWMTVVAINHFHDHRQPSVQAYYVFYLLLIAVLIFTAGKFFLRSETGAPLAASTILKPPIPAQLKQKGSWLKNMVKANRYYENPELSLGALAEKLDLHTHELSRIINTAFNKSFNDFINEYRVKAVVRKMQDTAYDHFTLLGIAFESGFNSQSTFTRIFRQMTGKTPMEYKNELKKGYPIYNMGSNSGFATIISYQETMSQWSMKNLSRNFMIKNYIKTAWRNLVRSRVYSLIAVVGLAIGLSVSILLFWGVNDEMVYDTQLADAPNIYRLNAKINMGENNYDTWINVPAPIAAAALSSFPGIEKAVRYNTKKVLVSSGESHFVEKNVAYTEPTFFDIFHIEFIKGNAATALTELNNMVLNNSTAIKYFGSADNALGKTLLLGEKQEPFIVAAIIQDMPQRSSVRKDILLSLNVVRKNFSGNGNWKTIDEDWGSFGFSTFFKVKPGTNVTLLAKQLSEIHLKNNNFVKKGDVAYLFQPLNTLRLYNPDLTPAGLKTVKIFVLIGVLILLIAVINYVNLSTARATKRAKEVGLRRVVGAGRPQLVMQFVTEFVLIFIVSLALSAVIIPMLVPLYQSISGKDYPIDYWNVSTLKIIGWVGLGTVILASIYPAWVLSSFNPTTVLKSAFSPSTKGGWLRKALVVLQFSFSVMLMICTVVVSKQLHFIQTKNLGYNRENVFLVQINADMGQHLQTVINDLKANKHIAQVTFATDDVMQMASSTDNIKWPGKLATNTEAHISPMEIAADFTKTMKMKFADGDGFTGTPVDSAYYLVNESAVRMMGLKHPVGTLISLWGRSGRIKGVLKDFNNNTMKTDIAPTIFSAAKSAQYGGVLYIKAQSEYIKDAVSQTEKIYHGYNPVRPFDCQFMDDNFDAMYRKEIQTSKLFTAFAGVAVTLSCLGLFGLAVFTAERRTKEIGIRKVLGASVQNISVLVSREFAWLVIIANLVAWPIAWYISHQWIQEFAYRTDISWWIFAASGIVSLALALLTVSSQALRAAMINPIKSLKVE
jgi:putative ABC transport system permease protein